MVKAHIQFFVLLMFTLVSLAAFIHGQISLPLRHSLRKVPSSALSGVSAQGTLIASIVLCRTRLPFPVVAYHTIALDSAGRAASRWCLAGLRASIIRTASSEITVHLPDETEATFAATTEIKMKGGDPMDLHISGPGALVNKPDGPQYYFLNGSLVKIKFKGDVFRVVSDGPRVSAICDSSKDGFLYRATYNEVGNLASLLVPSAADFAFKWQTDGQLLHIQGSNGLIVDFEYHANLVSQILYEWGGKRWSRLIRWRINSDYRFYDDRWQSPAYVLQDNNTFYNYAMDRDGFHVTMQKAKQVHRFLIWPPTRTVFAMPN